MLPSEVFYQDYSLWGEISNFLQPKLAVSSKKLHASLAHVPTGTPVHHFSEGSGQQQAATVPPQYNPGELSFQMHSCQYPHPFPAAGLHTNSPAWIKPSPATHNPYATPASLPDPPVIMHRCSDEKEWGRQPGFRAFPQLPSAATLTL